MCKKRMETIKKISWWLYQKIESLRKNKSILYLKEQRARLLVKVDKSHQFARTLESKKITGIAGDVIEQSVFGYKKNSKQECDIEIDGVLTEVKTTGVRVPKREQKPPFQPP